MDKFENWCLPRFNICCVQAVAQILRVDHHILATFKTWKFVRFKYEF